MSIYEIPVGSRVRIDIARPLHSGELGEVVSVFENRVKVFLDTYRDYYVKSNQKITDSLKNSTACWFWAAEVRIIK